MIFGNQIINGKGTPSIYEDTLANRPPASSIGRLFVQINSPYGIYRDTGTTWVQVSGGGGGGVGNWDQVLGNGGALTENRSFNFDYDFGLTFLNGDYFKLDGFNQFRIDYRNGVFPYDNYIIFDKNYLKYYTTSGVNTNFSFDYLNGNVAFGDFGGQFDGSHMLIGCSIGEIYFAPLSFAMLKMNGTECIIGDTNGVANQTKFRVNTQYDIIYSEFLSNTEGLYLQNLMAKFGDFDAVYQNHHIKISNDPDDPFITSFSDIANINSWYGFNIMQLIAQYGSYYMYMQFDDQNGLIQTIYGYDLIGLKLDVAAYQFYLGDFDNITGGGYILHNAGTRQTTFDTDEIILNGTITSLTSGSISTEHLIVWINGSQYKIQLRNP